ncbi:MAG: hypothetical protein LJU34_04990, partial [Oscillospiraceae bacterium]|nr:hypothetical protein [Oscillospiraceae bacterium]
FELTAKRAAFLRSIRENYYTIFTEEGLRDFVETGVMIELPRKYIPPFGVEDRLFFLTQLRSEIADGSIIGLIARPSYLRLPDYISIYIDSNMELHFATTEAFIYGAYACDVHLSEKSICQAFQTFFQSLPGSPLVYSQEETLAILDESIARLENMQGIDEAGQT